MPDNLEQGAQQRLKYGANAAAAFVSIRSGGRRRRFLHVVVVVVVGVVFVGRRRPPSLAPALRLVASVQRSHHTTAQLEHTGGGVGALSEERRLDARQSAKSARRFGLALAPNYEGAAFIELNFISE